MKQNAFSSKLARYLAGQFLIPLVCCLLGFTLLTLIVDLFDVLKEFMDHRASPIDVARYFLLLQPRRLVEILPVSLLLSAMYTFSNLSKHNEITAIKASGISIVRCCRYIWMIGGICVLFLMWFMEFQVPGSLLKAKTLNDELTTSNSKKMKSQVFAYRSVDSERSWVFGSFGRKGKGSEIILKQFRVDGTVKWEIRADSVIYLEDSGWNFKGCQLTEFDKSGAKDKPSESIKTCNNHTFKVRLNAELNETPDSIYGSLLPSEEATSRYLYKHIKTSKNLSVKTRNTALSIIFYRLFFPFSCMIALLIALPLSIASGRGGVFANIFAAFFMYGAYYLFMVVFRVLGQNGVIPPFLALLIPTVTSLGVGCVLMYKKR